MPHLRNRLILLAALTLTFALVLRQMQFDAALGGSEWRQGDWLINLWGGPVRRGLVGSALIGVSDATGIGLLRLTFAVQGGALLALLLGIAVVAVRAGPDDRMLVLLCSPGFFLFWANDPESSLRKEVLVCLALLPLIGAGRIAGWRIGVSVAVYALAVAAHEGNALLAPLMMLALLLPAPRRGVAVGAAVAVAVLAVAAIAFAARHGRGDAVAICAPLLARGLVPLICDGAIAWLGFGADHGLGAVAAQMRLPGAWTFGPAYGAALVPVWLALQGVPARGRWFGAALLLVLPLLPLYPVALDWGRWIHLHIAGIVILALILRARMIPAGPLPRPVFWGGLLIGPTFGIAHVGGTATPGILLPLISR